MRSQRVRHNSTTFTFIQCTKKFIWKFIFINLFPGGSVVENLPANNRAAGDSVLITGLGRSPEGGNGNPLQYSGWNNPMDRGAWQATVQRVAKSWT